MHDRTNKKLKNYRYLFDNKLIYFIKQIIYYILVIITSSIPILYVFNMDFICCILRIDINRGIDILLAILPLTLSILFVLINTIREYKKEQKELFRIEKEKINNIIEKYNSLITKTVANQNTIINNMFSIINYLKEMKKNPSIIKIIEYWENETKNYTKLSYNNNFKQLISNNLNCLINIFKENYIYDYDLEYINNFDALNIKQETVDNNDKVFVHSLRNYIDISMKESNILTVYLDLFSNGKLTYQAYSRLINSTKLFKDCYEKEIRNKVIDNDKLYSLLCGIFCHIFRYCEILSQEIYFLCDFQNLLQKLFSEYYDRESKVFNLRINKKLNPFDVMENIIIKKYIRQEILYEHYKIPL